MQTSNHETSLPLLGLPPDTRALIVNCDDLGLHAGANVGILDALERGSATSCSLMPPAPAAAAALDDLAARPDVDFGVHLTLTSDSAERPLRPVAGADAVPSLVDDDGCFTPQADIPGLLQRAAIDDVRRELAAQMAAVLDRGLSPSHLDWHCIADGGREDILEATLELAEQHGLAVRIWLEPANGAARRAGRPVVDHPFLDSFALDADRKAELLERSLRELPVGLNEWAIHPSADTPAVRELDPGWPVRTGDLQFCVSDRAREVIDAEGIHLLDYRALQRVWSNAS